MNHETMRLLEQQFDTAFAAPDGIQKLRELILTLAMQGKLVPQDPNDQPASELLKEIEVEKKKLVKAGKIKQPKPLPEVEPEEMPYDLPDTWEWVRIKNICHDWGQKTPDQLFTYIDVGSIDNTKGMISDDVQILESSEAPSRARKIVQQGTVIYSTVRPYLLNIAIIEKEYVCEPIASTAFAIIHPYSGINNRFIYHYLKSPTFIHFVESTMKGVAYPAINDGDFFQGLFPLPPLAEQHRIVAKIDQLMARCDQLEKLRSDRTHALITVHTTAIARLLTAQDSHDFSTAWHFITQHFGELYSVKATVAELRKTILQLAVMGKLVPQDPNDEPASELLKVIELEKQRLAKEGKIKQPKPLLKIKPEEIPYLLPNGWEWVRVIDVVDVGTGSTPATTNPAYYNGTIPWYTSSATNNIIAKTPDTFITESAIKETNCKIFPSGSLIIAMYGQGKTRGQISEIVVPGATNQAIAAMIFYESSQEIKRYIKYYFVKIYEEIRSIAEGGAQPNLNVGKIKETLIPLPPLAEQHRIVAKVDQLMALCDRLEGAITAAQTKQTDLLNAVMAQV